jgi:hypothetical protein
MALAVTFMAALPGCLSENELWVQIEFRSLYSEDRYIEAWITGDDHALHDDIGPHDGWGGHRYSTSFPCEEPHPQFHVVMKEYSGGAAGTVGKTLESKTWTIPNCKVLYTVLIDKEGTMNLYECGAKDFEKPCPIPEPPLEPVSAS